MKKLSGWLRIHEISRISGVRGIAADVTLGIVGALVGAGGLAGSVSTITDADSDSVPVVTVCDVYTGVVFVAIGSGLGGVDDIFVGVVSAGIRVKTWPLALGSGSEVPVWSCAAVGKTRTIGLGSGCTKTPNNKDRPIIANARVTNGVL